MKLEAFNKLIEKVNRKNIHVGDHCLIVKSHSVFDGRVVTIIRDLGNGKYLGALITKKDTGTYEFDRYELERINEKEYKRLFEEQVK